jgi:hypothetical protein
VELSHLKQLDNLALKLLDVQPRHSTLGSWRLQLLAVASLASSPLGH